MNEKVEQNAVAERELQELQELNEMNCEENDRESVEIESNGSERDSSGLSEEEQEQVIVENKELKQEVERMKEEQRELKKKGCSCFPGRCGRCMIFVFFLVYMILSVNRYYQRVASEGLEALAIDPNWQENLSVAFQQVLFDLRRPETWFGSEYVRMWALMTEALEQAMIHFEHVPVPPLFKLVPLLVTHINYVEEHKSRPDISWREWQTYGASSVNRSKLNVLHHYIDFANLAYETSDVVREEISQDGYLLLQWEPQVKYTKPCYFVAFHPGKREVIIAVRGTSSFTDLITDVIHTPVPFINGSYTHLGILEASRFIVNRTQPLLANLFIPLNYTLVLTGHSLGAGTATVASMIYKYEFDIANVKCIAFAPPPTLNFEASTLASDHVLAMIHNDDVIPRWNFNILAATFLVVQSIFEEMEHDNISVEEFYNKSDFINRTNDFRAMIESHSKTIDTKKDMHIAGQIIYFVETSKGYIWQEVPNNLPSLRRLEITRRMVRDHSMDGYLESLDFAINKTATKKSEFVHHHHYHPENHEFERANMADFKAHADRVETEQVRDEMHQESSPGKSEESSLEGLKEEAEAVEKLGSDLAEIAVETVQKCQECDEDEEPEQ